MNRAILSQRISSILDDTQRLNNALYAMNTTDIQRYPDNYEVLVTMLNAGVSILPWEKPDVFTSTPPDDPLTVDQPTYYSSREVKELGELAVKIRGSRSTGVLLEDGGIFVVYNTGPGQMKWEYKAEMRLKALLFDGDC